MASTVTPGSDPRGHAEPEDAGASGIGDYGRVALRRLPKQRPAPPLADTVGLPPAESPSEEAPEHDHGIWYSGGWQNRSENPGPGGQYPRLVIEWTTDLHRRGPVTIHAGLGVHEENSSGPGRFGETVTCPSILSLRGKVFYFL